jgi:hypothetical protein
MNKRFDRILNTNHGARLKKLANVKHTCPQKVVVAKEGREKDFFSAVCLTAEEIDG